jgi:hypothetical protein
VNGKTYCSNCNAEVQPPAFPMHTMPICKCGSFAYHTTVQYTPGQMKVGDDAATIERLTQERDALLAALKRARAYISGAPPRDMSLLQEIAAAIAKVQP